MSKKLILGAMLASLLPIAPNLHADTMLGAYVKGDGWSLTEMDALNSAVGKPMAITNLFTNFDYDWNNLKYQSDNIVSRGGVPLISWMPVTSSQINTNQLRRIASGKWDAYLNRWIDGFKQWRSGVPAGKPSRIMLRFGHEFNGNWYPWSDDPRNFKAAWRHIHKLFEQAGVNPYIDWVWCINNVDVDSTNDITQYYPGDRYVDWTAIDGYNWGSNYSFSSWKGFDEVFSSAYVKLVDNYPTKPIMLAEVGVAEPGDVPNPAYGQDGSDMDFAESKENWVANMFMRIEDTYPAIRGVSWFGINKELSWALHKPNNTGLTAYQITTDSPHYLSSYLDFTAAEAVQTTGGKPSGNPAVKRAPATQASSKAQEQFALAMSKRPQVVGLEKLQQAAKGFRHLPPQAIQNWRQGRLIPDMN